MGFASNIVIGSTAFLLGMVFMCQVVSRTLGTGRTAAWELGCGNTPTGAAVSVVRSFAKTWMLGCRRMTGPGSIAKTNLVVTRDACQLAASVSVPPTVDSHPVSEEMDSAAHAVGGASAPAPRIPDRYQAGAPGWPSSP